MKHPARFRIFAPKKFKLQKTARRAPALFFALACAGVVESCLAPDPRLYQIEKHRDPAAADSARQNPPAAIAPEPAPRKNAQEPVKTDRLSALATSTSPAIPEKQARKPEPGTIRSNDPDLRIIKEGGQTYGVYRLREGEALYSAVVVRFTGRVEAAEVNQAARELMALNGIQDETRIPIGAEIRIPLHLIDEAFFFTPAPALRAAPRLGQFKHVILDAGHGGNDPGTVVRDLREADIAYDLMKRLESALRKRGLKVHALVSAHRDANHRTNGHTASSSRRHQYVNVMPAYSLADSKTGLNLRIYLIEDIYSRLLREGAAPEEVAFLSIHLDHLHPAVGGTMLYIPAAEQRLASFKATGDIYNNFTESRGHAIAFDAQQNLLAESSSSAFAQNLVASLRRARLPVHAYKPIRHHVYRGGGKWTPGIIRYSRVPVSVLIEAANLAHRADWQRIRSSDFRQRWAEAVARAIVSTR